jgi:hypothetical protein
MTDTDFSPPMPLFMDCKHVRGEGAEPTGYVFIDGSIHVYGMVGCRICTECRERIREFLQGPVVGGEKREPER